MIATPGKVMTIKDLGTYELLGIDITDDNKKVKVLYLSNAGHPVCGLYVASMITITNAQ